MNKSFYILSILTAVMLLGSSSAFAKKAARPTLSSQEEEHFDDEMEVIMSEGKELSPKTKADLNKVISKVAPLNNTRKAVSKDVDPIEIERGTRTVATPIVVEPAKKNGNAKAKVAISDMPNVDLSIHADQANPNEDELLGQAYQALMMGQMEAATVLYKKILTVNKRSPSALFGLATIYQKSGQDADAKSLYTEILTRDPQNQQALNNFLVLVGEEAPESAIVELKKLEAVSPRFSPIPAQIGMIYAKMGNLKKSAQYLNKAMLLSPDNISYRYNLAIVFDRMGQSVPAIKLYKELIEASNNGIILPDSTQKIKERLIFLGAQ